MARTTQPAPAAKTKKPLSSSGNTATASASKSPAKKSNVSPAVKNLLKGASKTWGDAAQRAKENYFKPLPNGRYEARLASAEISEGDKAQIIFKYTVTAGTQTGETITKWLQLEGEYANDFLAQELIAFGVDVDAMSLEDLPEVLEALVEEAPLCSLQLRPQKKNPEYQEIKHLGKIESSASPEDEDDDSDEDVEDTDNEDEDGDIEDTGEDSEEEEEEVKPEPKKRGRPAKKPEPEPEPEEEEEESEEDEEDSDDEDEEEAELEEGSIVRWNLKGKEVEGIVREINEDEGWLKAVYEKTRYKVQLDDESLALVTD
jgi:hypothetical protein